jgi:hypothetical protein
VGTYGVEKVAVMGYYNYCVGEVDEEFLKP